MIFATIETYTLAGENAKQYQHLAGRDRWEQKGVFKGQSENESILRKGQHKHVVLRWNYSLLSSMSCGVSTLHSG